MKYCTAFLLVFIIYILPSSAQCYQELRVDASGFNTARYLDSLNLKACELKESFPDSFINQFKVYTLGFYLEQEHFKSFGYPNAFDTMRPLVASLSPYYLFIGRQTDHDGGVFSMYWVDIKLPKSGSMSCLNDSYEEVIKLELQNEARKMAMDHLNEPFFYSTIEQHLMQMLVEKLLNIKNCCTQSQNISNCINTCPNDDEIKLYLRLNDFNLSDSVILMSPIVSMKDTIHAVNKTIPVITNYDFVRMNVKIRNIVYDLPEEYNIRVPSWGINEPQITIIYTVNRHFCSDTITAAKTIWDQSASSIWIHLFVNPSKKNGAVYIKSKGFSTLDINQSPYTCNSDELSNQGLTAEDIKNILNSRGITGDLNNNKGKFFEIAYYLADQINPKFPAPIPFPSQLRLQLTAKVKPRPIGFVKPDFISYGFVVDTKKNEATLDVGIFYECKATNKTLSRSYRNHQLDGMIDVLHQAVIDKKILKAHFYIARTCDANISQRLIYFAENQGVALFEQVALKNGDYISFKHYHRLTSGGGIYEKIDFWNALGSVSINEVFDHWNDFVYETSHFPDPDPSGDDDDLNGVYDDP